MTSSQSNQGEASYFIDAENAAEMARLRRQDILITQAMGGLLPTDIEVERLHDILDLACGPGGWVLDAASTYPHKQVTGIDSSRLMVEYASAEVQAKHLDNAHFSLMNVLQPLDFADDTFDFINARFLFGFMPPAQWPSLLQECVRIARSQGIIRLTEIETVVTNSAAHEQFGEWFTHALYRLGQSLSPNGRSNGIAPMLRQFLEGAGCRNIRQQAIAIDFSVGTDINLNFVNNQKVAFKLLQPFLLKAGVATQEEIDRTYQNLLTELDAPNFYGLWFQLSTWGEKP